jgi:hypothetical protein
MKTNKETQTTSNIDFDDSFAISTIGKRATRENNHEEDFHFEADNKNHVKILLEWCKIYWGDTFKRSREYNNTIFYHTCCNSFSRRSFVKAAGHPSIQTCSILKIPGFRELNTAEDLHRWLLKMITSNTTTRKKLSFPRINKYHTDEVSTDEDIYRKEEEDSTYLQKRCTLILEELDQYKSQLKHLRIDNERLLSSTKNWFQKYNDILDQHDRLTQSAYQTPLKTNLKQSFELFSDQN